MVCPNLQSLEKRGILILVCNGSLSSIDLLPIHQNHVFERGDARGTLLACWSCVGIEGDHTSSLWLQRLGHVKCVLAQWRLLCIVVERNRGAPGETFAVMIADAKKIAILPTFFLHQLT